MDKEVELIAVTFGGNTFAGIPSSVIAEDADPAVRATPLNTYTYKNQLLYHISCTIYNLL